MINTGTRHILSIRRGSRYTKTMIQCYVVITRNAKGISEHNNEVTVNKTKHTNATKYVIVPSSVVI